MQIFEYMTVDPSPPVGEELLVCKPGLNLIREKGVVMPHILETVL
jgi:hypothetical protein